MPYLAKSSFILPLPKLEKFSDWQGWDLGIRQVPEINKT